MLLAGIAVQAVVLLARLLAKRYAGELAPATIAIFELIADGVTVFLFALATYQGILGHAAAV